MPITYRQGSAQQRRRAEEGATDGYEARVVYEEQEMRPPTWPHSFDLDYDLERPPWGNRRFAPAVPYAFPSFESVQEEEAEPWWEVLFKLMFEEGMHEWSWYWPRLWTH